MRFLAAQAEAMLTDGLWLELAGQANGRARRLAEGLEARGMALAFWKIAMRPGKPLMFGRLGQSRVLGLPGNPVSSLVCSRVFLLPLIRALLGQPVVHEQPTKVRLGVALEANGPRQHYMRAVSSPGLDGEPQVTPVRSQDSSLLSPLAEADCLLVRAPSAPAAPAGALVDILPLDL
jgi:molybdopterin molybdotransferase